MIPSEIKTVLLAGGSGLIGTRLREHLESKNYRVINLTRKAVEPVKAIFIGILKKRLSIRRLLNKLTSL
ncbi:MAG: NAD-dependent epimerase/dehydratase family protein [Bacteroidetes bacterium]|nr:NAD-dependent epimerase/dehydratase family protein [Bacteroidota bacterium]